MLHQEQLKTVMLLVTELLVKQVLQKKLVLTAKLVVIINTLHLTVALLLPMTHNMRYWYCLLYTSPIPEEAGDFVKRRTYQYGKIMLTVYEHRNMVAE